jgi:carboxypeptidase Taq
MAGSDTAVEIRVDVDDVPDGILELKLAIGRLNDVLNSISVLSWDSSVMMPDGPAPAAARGQQVATLTGVARSMLLSSETATALERAKDELRDADYDARETVARVAAAIDFHNRIPAQLSIDRAMIKAAATQAWTVAREQSDFSIFAPHLEKTVEISRAYATAIGVPDGGHPYDALLGLSEPGTTLASLRDLFAELRAGITPILRQAAANSPRTDFLHRNYPVGTQEQVAKKLAESIGYAFGGGRLDPTIHPFAVSFTSADVRITTRYYPDFINASIFGTLHESGHAMYEQGVAPELNRALHHFLLFIAIFIRT